MRLNLFSILITFGLTFLAVKTHGTAQVADILIEGRDTFALFSNPLEQYLVTKPSRTINDYEFTMTSTACYRGYLATWKIQNDSLFLISIAIGCHEEAPSYLDLNREFGTSRVYAKWVSGTLTSPRGSLLYYIHGGYASIFEKDKFFVIKNGKILSTELKDYLVYDKNLLNPSEDFLRDTLKKIIFKSLKQESINQFSDTSVCGLTIKFNLNGEIEEIKNSYTYNGVSFMEETILNSAKSVLKNFPRLMKVNHERYQPPIVTLFFSAHCVKYPWDKKYGCE